MVPSSGPSRGQATFDDNIDRVRKRLRAQSSAKETRGQILAGMDFGFWAALFHGDHEELWRSTLRKALPASSGKRKDVVSALEQLRVFRNRLAHHDSLLAVDVLFRLSQMRDVIRWIDPAAEAWFVGTERVTSTYGRRPVPARDTVVVAGRDAWPLYQTVHAYVCQAGRSFQPVDHVAFYADREVKPEVARVLRRVDNVDWSVAEANRLSASSNAADLRLAKIITTSRAAGWTEGRYQVFELTRPGDPGHLSLSAAVPHNQTGKGSAYTQRQRYTSRERLRGATSTEDLG